jgi:hypothetical protein
MFEEIMNLTQTHIEPSWLPLNKIYMRDPFILTDYSRGYYFLYGTSMHICDGAANIDPYFEVYISDNLDTFYGPYKAFEPQKGFWGVKNYWAPEVYPYQGKYYMFASMKGGIGEDRGTGILAADLPEGPFYDYSHGHVTLEGHECLDGTFYIDDQGKPWIVFCHEWTETYYGKIKALPLAEDLTKPLHQEAVIIVDTEKDPLPWIRNMYDSRVNKTGLLTDAPFLMRLKNGSLLLLWSSYSIPNYSETGQGGYVIASCISENGSIIGPWRHQKKLLLDRNTGHSSLFRSLNGALKLVSHCNDTVHGHEHPVIFDVLEKNDTIEIIQ